MSRAFRPTALERVCAFLHLVRHPTRTYKTCNLSENHKHKYVLSEYRCVKRLHSTNNISISIDWRQPRNDNFSVRRRYCFDVLRSRRHCTKFSINYIKLAQREVYQKKSQFTVFMRRTEKLFGPNTVADFRIRQHPHTIVGVFLEIFYRQILVR